MVFVVTKICVFELSSRTVKITPLDFCDLGARAKRDRVWLVSDPSKASRVLYVAATPEAVARVVSSFLFGVKNNEHDSALKKHISCLVKVRIATALDEAPDVVMEWQVRRDIFTGTSFFVHEPTLQRKKVPPLFNLCTVTSLF